METQCRCLSCWTIQRCDRVPLKQELTLAIFLLGWPGAGPWCKKCGPQIGVHLAHEFGRQMNTDLGPAPGQHKRKIASGHTHKLPRPALIRKIGGRVSEKHLVTNLNSLRERRKAKKETRKQERTKAGRVWVGIDKDEPKRQPKKHKKRPNKRKKARRERGGVGGACGAAVVERHIARHPKSRNRSSLD